MKIKLFSKIALWLVFSLVALSVNAGGDKEHNKQINWPFDGAFGTFDRQAAQRGYQVYKEVCAACHSLKLVSYRNLEAIGFSKAEIKTIAAEYKVTDGPNDAGDMFERPAIPSDRFVAPYANDNAARAANNGALPPDLSLIVKAREEGANYLYSLLTGYMTAPVNVEVPAGQYYNPYFTNKLIAMPQPLNEGQVTYADGTQSTVDQMSRDVVVFLQWAAEGEMEHRKEMGLKVVMFLVAFTVLFYFAKKRIWKDVEVKKG